MVPRSEKEKMLEGEFYQAGDPELVKERLWARKMTRQYNGTREDERDVRRTILVELLGHVGSNVFVETPFRCDYGYNISLGEEVFINFGCVALDVNTITIGDKCQIGPNVQLYTATHPLEPELRASWAEFGLPITLGNNVWLGGAVVVCPNVTIGDNSVIGAGSVVTKDIPSNVVAVGNPCRVIKHI